RGDQISVVSFAFDGGVDLSEELSPVDMAMQFQRPAIVLLALLATLIIAFRVTKSLRTAPTAGELAKGPNQDVLGGAERPASLDDAAQTEGILPAAPATTRDKVAAQIDAQPEVAVKMIRTWMREEA